MHPSITSSIHVIKSRIYFPNMESRHSTFTTLPEHEHEHKPKRKAKHVSTSISMSMSLSMGWKRFSLGVAVLGLGFRSGCIGFRV